jgi:hypothetical protein
LGLFGSMGIATEQPQRQPQPILSASFSQEFDAFVVAPQPPVTPTTNGQRPRSALCAATATTTAAAAPVSSSTTT